MCIRDRATQASGERSHAIATDALPLTIGRSRDQAIVIDRRHPGVSGQHVAIDAVDDNGARGVVHGDNGIVIDGVAHGPGERFDWLPHDDATAASRRLAAFV